MHGVRDAVISRTLMLGSRRTQPHRGCRRDRHWKQLKRGCGEVAPVSSGPISRFHSRLLLLKCCRLYLPDLCRDMIGVGVDPLHQCSLPSLEELDR